MNEPVATKQSTAGENEYEIRSLPKGGSCRGRTQRSLEVALGVCSGLLSFTSEKQSSGIHSGPSQDILTEGVWSLPSGGHVHGSLSTCVAFPEGTIFYQRGDWLPSRGKKIATENQPRLEVKQNAGRCREALLDGEARV